MKKYNSVYELAAELDAQDFIKDRDITIPADTDSDAGCLQCDDGYLYSFPEYRTYFIHPTKQLNVYYSHLL